MHLFAKIGLALAFWGLLLQPAWSVSGKLKERSALCIKPQKECTAQFYLNPQDAIQVLHPSLDQKWFKVRFLGNNKEGWVPAEKVALVLPQSLALIKKSTLDTQAAFFQGKALSLWKSHRISEAGKNELKLLSLMSDEHFLTGFIKDQHYHIYSQQIHDKNSFLIRWTESPPAQPVAQTLMRLNPEWKPPPQIAELPAHTLILGRGTGVWGDTLLLGLKADFPTLMLKDHEDLFPLLDPDLRQRIIPDSVFLSALSPDGSLYITVQFRFDLKYGLVKLTPSTQVPWKAEGFIHWPKGYAPHSVKKKTHLPIQVWSKGADTYLYFPQVGKLFYYSLTPEPIFEHQFTAQSTVHLGEDGLWSLHNLNLEQWRLNAQ